MCVLGQHPRSAGSQKTPHEAPSKKYATGAVEMEALHSPSALCLYIQFDYWKTSTCYTAMHADSHGLTAINELNELQITSATGHTMLYTATLYCY